MKERRTGAPRKKRQNNDGCFSPLIHITKNQQVVSIDSQRRPTYMQINITWPSCSAAW